MPRPTPTVRIAPAVRPAIRARRPPAPLIDVLLKPETELRQRIRELESSDVFKRLLRKGVIARRGLRGRIPRAVYEEYMQKQFVEFLREYDIDARGDWRTDFLRPHALTALPALAHKYGAPPATLARFVRYLRSMSSEWASTARPRVSDGARPDAAEYTPGPSEIDVSEAASVAQEFVERYGVAQTDFIADFIHGDANSEELATKYGAEPADVARILQLVDGVQIADAAVGPPPPAAAPGPTARTGTERETQIIATVKLAHAGDDIQIEFDETAGYALHYRIDPTALEEGETDADVRRMLDELRWINQRRSLVSRLAAFLCTYQTAFFRTGESLLLKPISQAEVARQLREHPSAVSRAIRDKYVAAPHGTFALQFLCQSTGDVVHRIIRDDRSLSDKEVQELLRRQYDCDVSRRTVNYHRLKASAPREPEA